MAHIPKNDDESLSQRELLNEIKKLRSREKKYLNQIEQRKQKEEFLRQSIQEKDLLIQQLQVFFIL